MDDEKPVCRILWNKKPQPIPFPKKKRPARNILSGEILKFATIALVIVAPIRLFIASPFIVSGASMEPAFDTGHYLIIDQITYRFEEPVRGDVIVFRYPNDPSKFSSSASLDFPARH